MRGADITQSALFSYRTLEERIPQAHPLRKLRAVVDAILVSMDAELDALYADTAPTLAAIRSRLNVFCAPA